MRGKFGLLFGAIAGATLGLLFAPRKGSELREKIKKDMEKGGSCCDALTGDFKKMGEEMYGFAKEIYTSKDFQEQIKKGKIEIKKYIELAKKKAEEYRKLAEKYATKKGKEAKEKSEEYKEKSKMYISEAKKFATMKGEEFAEEIKKQATKLKK